MKLFKRMTYDKYADGEEQFEDALERSGYRVVTLQEGYSDLLEDSILCHVPPEAIKKNNLQSFSGHKTFQSEFNRLNHLEAFTTAAFSQNLVLHSSNRTMNSFYFLCPYGFVFRIFDVQGFKKFEPLFLSNNKEPLLLSCEGDQGQLQGEYGNVRKHFVFIKQERLLKLGGKDNFFMECFLPDENADFQPLLESVDLRGRVGWVINTSITVKDSFNPVMYMKNDITYKSVHPFTFHFLPFQAINGVLQANVRPLLEGIVENDGLLASTSKNLVIGFDCPENFTVWIGNSRDIGVEDGALLGCHVMFKLETGWTHMKVIRFYHEKQNGKFQVQRYGHGVNAALSMWCLLRAYAL